MSSLKCNGLWRGLIVDDQLAEDFVWGEEVEDFSGSVVEALGNVVEVLLGVAAEIGAFGEILPDQAVGVFVAGSLPWAVGVGEVDLDAGVPRQLGVAGHFGPAVVGKRLAQSRGDGIEGALESTAGGIGIERVHAGKQNEAAAAFDQGTDGRAICRSLDQVALPMAGDQPLEDVFGPGRDLDIVGDEAAPIGTARPRSTVLAPLAQGAEQFATQLAARQRIERAVDGLMADRSRTILGIHAPQSAGDLQRRPAGAQMIGDVIEQRGAHTQFAPTDTAFRTAADGAEISVAGIIARRRIAAGPLHLPAHRRRVAHERAGNCPHAHAIAQTIHDR